MSCCADETHERSSPSASASYIYLFLLSPRIALGNKDFTPKRTELPISFLHKRRIVDSATFRPWALRPQAAPNATRSMPLLARSLPVRFQDRLDEVHHRRQLRLLTTWRWRSLGMALAKAFRIMSVHSQLASRPFNRPTPCSYSRLICSNGSTFRLLSNRTFF